MKHKFTIIVGAHHLGSIAPLFNSDFVDVIEQTQFGGEPFMIHAQPQFDEINIDPTLPWPKSFQDPKGEKTGTKTCSMKSTTRRKLKAKRKKKR